MIYQNLAILMLRCMALYFLTQCILYVPSFSMLWAGEKMPLISYVPMILPVIVYAGGTFLLWCYAPQFAKWMTKGMVHGGGDFLAEQEISRLSAVLYACAGFLILSSSIRPLSVLLHDVMSGSFAGRDIIQAGAYLLLGGMLIFTSQGVAKFVHTIRNA